VLWNMAAVTPEDVSGFYFEIVESKDKVAGKAFPDCCGPFNIEKTNISGAALQIEWGPPKTWAEREKAVTVTKEKLSSHAQSLDLGASFNLSASPLHPVNLTVEGRRAAGIPENADHFVWVYPATFSTTPPDDVLKQSEVAFLHNGGFMYFDSQLKPVQINAIVFGGDSLCFGPQKPWKSAWTETLQAQSKRFHPVTIKALRDVGVSDFMWIPPNTNVGVGICPLGGFAYLKSASTKINGITPMPAKSLVTTPNPKNNIILMTDGYKFSHHKQFPVSWLPQHARPQSDDDLPPILFPGEGPSQGATILRMMHVPRVPWEPEDSPYKVTIVTNVATAVQTVQVAADDEQPDITYDGIPVSYTGIKKSEIVVALSAEQCANLRLPTHYTKIKFPNVDESKLKRGSNLNKNFEGGCNVSYFTPRAYSHVFSNLSGENIVFFGLQYFMKEYLSGEVVTEEIIDEADAFIARYMADVRVAGPGVKHEGGYDYTMFPRGDWEAMVSGDYDAVGKVDVSKRGRLPIRVEALPEGTLLSPGVCCFKITNTHPRYYWLPNFLETLLVQVWYPMTVATQSREFKKTIQAYGILSQRVSQMAAAFGLPGEFTADSVAEDNLAIHVAQVFDLLDFGYRGVSSHETASLGAAAYYTAGLEGSDTVAGSRMLLRYYNSESQFLNIFEVGHGATSVPAAEHSTITSWADVSPEADATLYEAAEYNAFRNMIKQYMPSFAVSLVSDGFNIWNAVSKLWPCDVRPADGGESMRELLAARLKNGQLNLIRPDSGEGIETLPQLLTILFTALKEHWEEELPAMRPVFTEDEQYEARYTACVQRIQAKVGKDGNPFRRFRGQQMRVLQGDGVALDTVGDMMASILANGFCVNCVHFGSGGGLLQKLNRDSLAVAFKCCAMYVGDICYPVGKDPIAGGKKSYGGNPPVMRIDGVLRNRGQYEGGEMILAQPMSTDEFKNGVAGDELVKVFENGNVLVEQNFKDVQSRARITKDTLIAAMRKAVDNLELKMEFMQKMSSDEAIACRLAEGACGSKWKHTHGSHLEDTKKIFPQYVDAFEKIGITSSMTSTEILTHIKQNHLCDKSVKKKIFRALEDDEPAEATKAMGSKFVITL